MKKQTSCIDTAIELLALLHEMKHLPNLNWFVNTQLFHLNSLRWPCRKQSFSAFSPS